MVVAYLAALLYLYPYGIPLGSDASVRVPDLLGLLCLFCGAAALLLRGRMRVDAAFFAIVGPFVLLELATPVVGAVGYRKFFDAVSSVRIAVLWLPFLLLALLASAPLLPRFERSLRRLLVTGLWLNAAYCLVQIAVEFRLLPGWMEVTKYLEPWTVEGHFDLLQGLRPAGFFANATALSVFAIVCLSYFYAQYASRRAAADLWHSAGSLLLVVLTTSRVAFASAALIVAAGWLVLGGRRKRLVLGVFLCVVVVLLVAVEQTVGIEQAFYRFTRLADSGLLGDVSFGQRVLKTWPAALAVARDYPLGTLVSAPKVAELIDSGFLNYYIQGSWAFVAAVAVLLGGQIAIGLDCLRRPLRQPAGLMLLFLSIYVTLAMVVSNPMRSPIVVAAVVFAFWKLKTEREGRWVRAVPGRAADP